MPLPPSPPLLPLATPVTSSDGVLTATVDPNTASVLLKVLFTAVSGTSTATAVTVTRTGGATGNVRGLDTCPAPAGVTAGLDHEAPLNVAVTYTATARAPSGTAWTSTSVQVLVPAPSAWLKSLTTPALSVPLTVQKYPDWDHDIPVGVFRPFDRADPIIRIGKAQLATGTIVVTTRSQAAATALHKLLASGGPFLMQPSAQSQEPDRYVTRQLASRARPFAVTSQPRRDTTLPLVEILRPSTYGTRVAIPGHTYADSAVRWPTYSSRTGTYLDRATT